MRLSALLTPLAALPLLIGACATSQTPRMSGDAPDLLPSETRVGTETADPAVGVLVMAHGGTPEWNDAVHTAVAELQHEGPVEIAFGMADPHSLQDGLDRLEAQGARHVALLRLFLTGSSFLHQTEYLLGLREDPPRIFITHRGLTEEPPHPVRHALDIRTHPDGLSAAVQAGEIVRKRALAVSRDPDREAVLVLGHGAGDEAVNDALLARMAVSVRELAEAGFAAVDVATLREDWPEARARAETGIRSWVADQGRAGRRVIVIPFRLFGAGPYAEVLSGLDFEMTEGLLPDGSITTWLEDRLTAVTCGAGWRARPCPGVADTVDGPDRR